MATNNPIQRAFALCLPTPSKSLVLCWVLTLGSAIGLVTVWLVSPGSGWVAYAVGATIGAYMLTSMYLLDSLPDLLIIPALPALLPAFLLDGIVDRFRLKTRDKILSEADVREKLEMASGTFIEEVDHYWVLRLWWTEDQVPSSSLDPNDPANQRILKEYLNTRHGKAYLVEQNLSPEELSRARVVRAGCWP